ncbi:MAG: hypothetical protein KGI54_18805 [Pseudomonadota bacterium]|nr:hypothetical protein [Pseudomonadota bacterium]
MKSIRNMIDQLEGLLGTNDLSLWETGFVETVVLSKSYTQTLTEKQISIIDRIYQKHFGD